MNLDYLLAFLCILGKISEGLVCSDPADAMRNLDSKDYNLRGFHSDWNINVLNILQHFDNDFSTNFPESSEIGFQGNTGDIRDKAKFQAALESFRSQFRRITVLRNRTASNQVAAGEVYAKWLHISTEKVFEQEFAEFLEFKSKKYIKQYILFYDSAHFVSVVNKELTNTDMRFAVDLFSALINRGDYLQAHQLFSNPAVNLSEEKLKPGEYISGFEKLRKKFSNNVVVHAFDKICANHEHTIFFQQKIIVIDNIGAKMEKNHLLFVLKSYCIAFRSQNH